MTKMMEGMAMMAERMIDAYARNVYLLVLRPVHAVDLRLHARMDEGRPQPNLTLP
jgi:hypothetical protein